MAAAACHPSCVHPRHGMRGLWSEHLAGTGCTRPCAWVVHYGPCGNMLGLCLMARAAIHWGCGLAGQSQPAAQVLRSDGRAVVAPRAASGRGCAQHKQRDDRRSGHEGAQKPVCVVGQAGFWQAGRQAGTQAKSTAWRMHADAPATCTLICWFRQAGTPAALYTAVAHRRASCGGLVSPAPWPAAAAQARSNEVRYGLLCTQARLWCLLRAGSEGCSSSSHAIHMPTRCDP